jgi:hypothetical protein
LAVVSQIIRHWLMANWMRANIENSSMRTAVMVVAWRISVPAGDAGPYRTPVPGDRYWTRGQWRLLLAAGERRFPFPATARFVEIR